ncbi:hypothetical protein EDEG_00227 [Edhazardia aedis USNM 41457]|uniref:Uncharacterized protein n=1 Tax=Edhazardia aedis (strain USNM 41457) TaxID=1003232 RepID=J9DPH4_EDHAE|nr:hypothetical protein EDEG_00227 [Edhazardia aedis USNM 41457]|eukprot:EJW03247.1 hypothetical protein EDEG_00227 [Edhazardia aedis USNM 41457]
MLKNHRYHHLLHSKWLMSLGKKFAINAHLLSFPKKYMYHYNNVLKTTLIIPICAWITRHYHKIYRVGTHRERSSEKVLLYYIKQQITPISASAYICEVLRAAHSFKNSPSGLLEEFSLQWTKQSIQQRHMVASTIVTTVD